ncbi:bifunctional adenosylcobinamide kinase/adenosylcobinamide-phosphate guanylyltransferase [Novosphingobium sp. 9]|uniref:bifunctional adenosylcobinamide kinase/adenosylcobinamide-phosphate guanylyltransferase n=1 Tax=Novosphingobium sp. 9 TaxID=2025349 RepID=UPI0021B57E2A|nr:bifunctional adenosylcobinamide kinase/adenosylcobinamide-phosphate guanylyltransferase [Novosphingobium sp. 9]
MSSLLVIGGARSGKSRYAQGRAEALGQEAVYIATAQAFDEEMHARIASHKADRGEGWRTVEAPLDLPQALAANDAEVLLVDCLTLWTSNLMLADRDIPEALDRLIEAINAARGTVILVTNEVGLGIVPDNALARRFRDAAGIVNQRVAACVEEVQFLCAGLNLRMK